MYFKPQFIPLYLSAIGASPIPALQESTSLAARVNSKSAAASKHFNLHARAQKCCTPVDEGAMLNTEANNPGNPHELNCLYICLDAESPTQQPHEKDGIEHTRVEPRELSGGDIMDADDAVAYHAPKTDGRGGGWQEP